MVKRRTGDRKGGFESRQKLGKVFFPQSQLSVLTLISVLLLLLIAFI